MVWMSASPLLDAFFSSIQAWARDDRVKYRETSRTLPNSQRPRSIKTFRVSPLRVLLTFCYWTRFLSVFVRQLLLQIVSRRKKKAWRMPRARLLCLLQCAHRVVSFCSLAVGIFACFLLALLGAFTDTLGKLSINLHSMVLDEHFCFLSSQPGSAIELFAPKNSSHERAECAIKKMRRLKSLET
jgi:hypothetical protein